MADGRLRELERAAAGGDLEAHGRLIQEKVRLGQLDVEQVELLAHCFWPPAHAALGWKEEEVEETRFSMLHRSFRREGQDVLYKIPYVLGSWAHGLQRWGSTVAMRVGAAAARHRWPSWEFQYDDLVLLGLELPCPKERIFTMMHLVDLQISKPGQYPLVYRTATYPLYEPLYRNASVRVLDHEGRAIASSGPITRRFGELTVQDPRIVPTTFGNLGMFAGSWNYHWLAEAVNEACAVPLEQEPVFEAIRSELVPWVLGESDPVLDRLARERRT